MQYAAHPMLRQDHYECELQVPRAQYAQTTPSFYPNRVTGQSGLTSLGNDLGDTAVMLKAQQRTQRLMSECMALRGHTPLK
jgi:hypothetical protein